MQITAMKKDDFYRQMFKLTIPIIIQNLLSAAVNSADVIMLNYVGQSAISAVSLASNFSNVLFMVYYGLGTGATLLCAQYYGKGNLEAIHTVEGITLRFSMAISGIIHLFAQEYDTVVEQAGENVIGTLTAVGLLHNVRD